MPGLRITHESSVTEDQIDHLGHMNVRYYAVNARAGTDAILAPHVSDGLRFTTDDVYTRHHREQLLGTPLEVRSGFLGIDDHGRLRIHHELRAADTEILAATFVHRVVATDDDGAATSLPERLRATASVETIALPDYATPRTIDLDTDLLASSPDLATLRDRGLAVRAERAVPAEECDDDGAYRPELAPLLVWGGDPVPASGDTLPFPYETDTGELMAWASMETRIAVRRWPARGDRIQSFGAGLQVLDKVTHRINWSYDLDRAELLAAFEVVSMAFDIRARRPMSIPAAMREQALAGLHPELAPT